MVGSNDKKVIFNRIEIKIKSTAELFKKNRELLKSVILEIKIEIKIKDCWRWPKQPTFSKGSFISY